MNPKIQSHIGSILVALAGIGTELLGKTSADAPEAEPTTDTPKTRKPRQSAAAAPNANDPITQPLPAESTTEIGLTSDGSPQVREKGGKSWEELKKVIEPVVKAGKGGPPLKAIIAKYLPDARKQEGLKALAEFPQNHAAFEKDVEALL